MESITTSHKPNRVQAVGFFIFSLVLAAGVLSWYFVFNTGTLNVTGEFPFEVTAGDERTTCTASPCSFKLTARSYSVSIKKERYFPETRSVNIKRGTETKVEVNFVYMPTRKEIKTRPAFMNNSDGSVKRIVSPSKDSALEIGTSTVDVISLIGGKKNTVTLSPSQVPGWLGKNIVYIDHTADGKDIIMQRSVGLTEAPETVATFARPLLNPLLLGSDSGEFLLVRDDATLKDKGSSTYYLVDNTTHSKQVFMQGVNIKNPRFAGDTLFFESNKDGVKKIMGITLTHSGDNTGGFSLGAVSADLVVQKSPGIFIFLSNTDLAYTTSSNSGRSVEDILRDTEDGIAQETSGVASIYLMQYDSTKNLYTLLISIPIKKDEQLNTLVISPDGNHVFFEKGGQISQIDLVEK